MPTEEIIWRTRLLDSEIMGVNKEPYLILETLPTEYDSPVKAMEVVKGLLSKIEISEDWISRFRDW